MRLYKIEKLKSCSREDLLMKLDIVKSGNLTFEEKEANIKLIDGVLNPVSMQDEAFQMMMDGRADEVKMD